MGDELIERMIRAATEVHRIKFSQDRLADEIKRSVCDPSVLCGKSLQYNPPDAITGAVGVFATEITEGIESDGR